MSATTTIRATWATGSQAGAATGAVAVSAVGPAGPTGAAGPNSVSDATAVGSLASISNPTAFVVVDSTGLLTRKFVHSAVGLSVFSCADTATGRAALAAAGTGVANTFAVGQVVTGGTFTGATATAPGISFKFSDEVNPRFHIGGMGSSNNILGIWSGATATGNPTMGIIGSTVVYSGSFSHLTGAFTFNCRSDLGTGNPGFTIQSFGAAMTGLNIQAPASFTGFHQKLSGVTTGAGASNKNQAGVIGGWGVSTHGSQTGYVEFGVYYVDTYQPGLRITASASGPVYTFGGTFPYLPSTATVTEVAGTSFSVGSSDSGKVYRTTSGSAVTCTLSGTAAEGTQITVSQKGSGQVTFTVSGSGSLVPPFGTADNKTAGTNAMVTLIVDQNIGGSAAEWKLAGETAA